MKQEKPDAPSNLSLAVQFTAGLLFYAIGLTLVAWMCSGCNVGSIVSINREEVCPCNAPTPKAEKNAPPASRPGSDLP